MFTAQHYVKVASILRPLGGVVEKDQIIKVFVEMFKEDNPKFNPTKFIEACFDENWE